MNINERRNFIGGSDIASIIGVSPWKTPLDTYYEKKVITDEKSDNEFLYWGRSLEKNILERYKEKRKSEEVRNSIEVKSDKYPYMIGHLDGVNDTSRKVIEIKNISHTSHHWKNGNIPEYYKCQIAYYCYLTEMEKADVAVLFNGCDYKEMEYIPDKKYQGNIINLVRYFWWMLENNTPPNPSNAADIEKYITADNEKIIKINDEININNLKELVQKKKTLDSEIEEIKNKIKCYMGEATILEDNNNNLLSSWKTVKSSRFDSLRFKKDFPDMYKKYKKECVSRVFRLHGENKI